MENTKRIVEIDGVKIEVDLRTAKKVENYRVGDNVKVLVKGYSNTYTVHPGVIVGFDDFQKLPTISVAYLETGYNSAEIKFAALNAQSSEESKIEISPMDDVHELHFKKADVLNIMDGHIEKKNEERRDLERKKAYFEKYFGMYFEKAAEPAI